MDPLGTPEVTRASDDTIPIYYYLLASATERLSTQDINWWRKFQQELIVIDFVESLLLPRLDLDCEHYRILTW